MAKVPNGVETLRKISIAWRTNCNVRFRHVGFRQTTDGRTIAYIERERDRFFMKILLKMYLWTRNDYKF